MLTLIWQAWRSWKNSKGLALLAVIALAIGIGCTTAIFTIVDAVLLKPLPYSNGDRWVALFGSSTAGSELDRYSGLSYADLLDYQQRTHSFDAFGWFTIGGDFNLTSPGAPQHINGIEVTPSLVGSLGVNPAIGRLFSNSDGENVALISNRLWKRLGGDSGDSSILGKGIELNGQVYIVTGVMPPWFRLPVVNVSNLDSHDDVWIPVKPPRDEGIRRTYGMYACYARMKPGVTIAQARADAKRAASEIARENPSSHQSYSAALIGLRDFVVKSIRPVLLLLFGAAGLLLLITCANVAGLLVTRSVGRAREIAIRIALGGGQRQLATQFLFEGLFLSMAAAVLGIAASFGLVRFVLSLAGDYIPRSEEISVNWAVLLFALGLGCLAAVLSALAPLWQALRTQPNEVLSDGVRASAGTRSRKLSQSLVIAEIALAFTLLSVSALLVSQLDRLHRVSPGFDPDGLLTFQLRTLDRNHQTAKEFFTYQSQLLRALEAVPSVSSVAFANQLPLKGCCFSSTLFPEGQPANSAPMLSVSTMIVSPGYFKTMRIPLQGGRLLNEHDEGTDPIRVVIDEAAAKRYWPNRNSIGATGRISAPDGSRIQVIGVVGNVRNQGLGESVRPEVYLLNLLAPVNPMQFVVRSPLPSASLIPSIRQAIQKVDPAQPIYDLRSMERIVTDSLTTERLNSTVITFFALAALLLASLGIYGVTSYSTRQRTVEIGTRMALGATSRDLLRLIVGSGLKMAIYGIAIGAVATGAATWLVIRFFNVRDLSPSPYLYSIAIVAALAMFASFFPAWRATLLSPMVAIRNESDSIWSTARRGFKQVLGVAPDEERMAMPDAALLTEFASASRHADSFPEALRLALKMVCEKFQAESAMLLERSEGQEYSSIAAAPEGVSTLKIPSTGFLLNRLRFYTFPLAFTPADLDTAFRWASEQRPQYLSEIETLKRSDMHLAVPLRAKDEIVGLLLLGAPVGRRQYNSKEKQLLRACGEQLALMMENARLTDRIVEQEKVRRDIALAVEVQKRLLPESSPEGNADSIEAFTLPARSVGGDYYDFLNIGDHRIGIALADVAGKGIAAALIMAVVQASLRIIAADGQISLPDLAAKMNRFLHQSTGSTSYATFFYAQIDGETRQLRYVNAGHNPPYLVRSLDASSNESGQDADIEELATGGMVIGMFPVANYEESTVDLRSGDVLLAFTDGVTEALNPNDEEYGEERLKELLRRVAHLPVKEIRSSISGELRHWIADAPQHDDLTFIVMKVN